METLPFKPHRPVALKIKRPDGDVKVLTWRCPEPLPRERIIGPLPKPDAEGWTGLGFLVDQVHGWMHEASDSQLQTRFSRCYRLWADLAEEELVAATDGHLRRKGRRGVQPRLVWKQLAAVRRRPDLAVKRKSFP